MISGMPMAVLAVNGYLWDTLNTIDPTLARDYSGTVPIFPIGDPSTGHSSWEGKPYIIYDRMVKFTQSSFYPIKKEHIIYSLKADEINTLEWGSAIQLILDRSDDAAKDINDWIRNNGGNTEYPVYFHQMRVYQTRPQMAGSSENVRDFSSRPFYVTDFVIDMEYHGTKSLEDYL
jgi:hypothetical protein